MKKKLSFLIILLIVLNFNAVSYGESDLIDIGISKNINYMTNLGISSDYGFTIYENDREFMNLTDRSIFISIDTSGDINIFDEAYNILYNGRVEDFMISGGSYIYFDGSEYRGSLRFVNKGKLKLVNRLNINEYLYGVLPKEISPSYPEETIKAQALVSRTFAFKNMGKHKADGFDLCDTTHCQVYGGMAVEKSNMNALVDETRDYKIYYGNSYADTTFHANNGGYIESAKDVWGGEVAYLVAKEDPYSLTGNSSNWELILSKGEIEEALVKNGIKIGTLDKINLLEVSGGKRVKSLELVGSLKSEVITGTKLRSILGNTKFKSTLFTIDGVDSPLANVNNSTYYVYDGSKSVEKNIEGLYVMDKDGSFIYSEKTRSGQGSLANNSGSLGTSIVFKGHGYGHGVGMSQEGAREMGKQGFTYEEIIKFYYPGVEIRY